MSTSDTTAATAVTGGPAPRGGDRVDPALTEGPQLRRGTLGIIDNVVIAMSSTAPAYSIAVSLVALAGAVSLHMPAAMWVGALPVLGIALGFYYMNRHDPNCGASYTWVGRALHPGLGFINGWVILAADLVFLAFAAPVAGQATLQLLNNAHLQSLGAINLNSGDVTATTLVGVFWLVVVTFMCLVGIKIAARFQWLLLGLEYLIVLGFCIAGFAKGGGTKFSFDWLNPFSFGSFSALAGGVVIAVFLYWGWDTAANINEETDGARENPGKGGLYGMLGLLLLFELATISVQMVLTPDELAKSGANTIGAWASKLASEPIASLAVLALISSTVATLQTTLLPSARTSFSMGRDGVLGSYLARVHSRWRTPWISTLIFGVGAALIALLDTQVGKLAAVITAGVAAIGILVSFYYGMAGLASLFYFRRTISSNVKTFIFAGVIPLVSALVLFFLAGYLIYSNLTATDAKGNSIPIAFDGANLKFDALVPILLLLSAIPAFIFSRIVHKNARFYHMPRDVVDLDEANRTHEAMPA